MTARETRTASYWGASFTVEEPDLEHLSNLLLEEETPLTTLEMARAIIQRRCDHEAEMARRRGQGAVAYLPRETYTIGQKLTFPAMKYAMGAVVGLRAGRNPEAGEFDVVAVDFGDGRPPREFAARYPVHKLNHEAEVAEESERTSPDVVFSEHGTSIAQKLEARLSQSDDIVRIAGRWFPRALLANINVGHLNLAEAVLDMAGGGPLPPDAILKEIGLPDNINPRLQAFSLNFALQEDERFDEVGPAGQVQWYLRRLEPPEAVYTPRWLENPAPAVNLSRLPPPLLEAVRETDDEWSAAAEADAEAPDEVTVNLTFPHRRAGTLPLSTKLAPLFPTAYESQRIRFMLVDGETQERFPGWVVRAGRYVYGLEEWYERYQFPPGGLLTVRRGEFSGEVVVSAQRRRSGAKSEWVRTAGLGADGMLRLETLPRKMSGINYDDLTLIVVDSLAAFDDAWQVYQRQPFDRLVAHIFRELAKLDTQGKVHARTLYAAVNVSRRSPPGPIFAQLISQPYYIHVGDAYWRFDQSQWTEENR